MRLYNSGFSGNCYKVRLMLAHLGLDYERIDVDVVAGGPRPGELTEGNPAGGRVPMLVLDDGSSLPESNAILWRLAQGTDYLPGEPAQVTQVLRWMFFERCRGVAECRKGTEVFIESTDEASGLPRRMDVGSASGNVTIVFEGAFECGEHKAPGRARLVSTSVDYSIEALVERCKVLKDPTSSPDPGTP